MITLRRAEQEDSRQSDSETPYGEFFKDDKGIQIICNGLNN